jgi:hypothetical protein
VLTSATASAWAASMPRLAAYAKPVLRSRAIVVTGAAGGAVSISDSDPSVEPLSTTTISAGGVVCSFSASRHCASQRRPFQLGTMTATSIRRESIRASGCVSPGIADQTVNGRSWTTDIAGLAIALCGA